MSIGNTIRFGKNGTNGSFDDNWLPVYGGEVLTAFAEYNQFLDKVRFRQITKGNSAEFPAIWKIGSEYHEAGVELLGLDVETVKYVITLDDRPLVAHYAFDDIDEAMSHYSVRSEVAQAAGRELANTWDKNLAILLIKAAREAANGPFPGGTNSDTRNTTGHTDLATFSRAGATAVLNAIEDALIFFEENDVPQEDIYCAVPVGMWWKIKNLGIPASAAEVASGLTPVFGHPDFNRRANTLDQGGISMPVALDFNGVQILKTNHLPGTSSSGSFTGRKITTGPPRYQGDFSTTAGIIWQKQAIGAVQLAGVMTEQDRDVRRQQDFFLTKIHMGGGSLRPVCAYELKTA